MNLYNQIIKKLVPEEGDLFELIRGSSIGFSMKIAGLGCAELFAFVVSRVMGAEAWGVFSMALSMITIGSIIGTLGLDIGLLKLAAGNKAAADTSGLYSKSLLLTCIASGICTVLVYYNAHFIAATVFNKPSMTKSFKIAAFAIFPFSLMKLNTQTLRGLKKITKYVFLNFVARHLFALLFLLLLLVITTGNNLVIIAYIIGLYVIVGISFFWLSGEDILSGFLEMHQWFKKHVYYRLLKISLPLLLASSLTFVKGWIDTIMVGIFLTKADVGIYNIALKLSALTAIILTAVNTIAAPKFAEAYENNDTDQLEQVVHHSTRMIFYGSLPILIIFLIIPGPILSIFGSEFTAGKYALILLSIGNFINAIAGSVGYFMQMTGSQVAFQNITLVSTCLGVGLNYLLIPMLGIEGAALSTCIGLIVWNLSCVLFIRYKYGIRTYYNPFIS
jgi:O-antigen/teichoic acid export membrane protein